MSTRSFCAGGAGAVALALALPVSGQPLDFNTFVDWQGGGAYPLADTFDVPNWVITDLGATAACLGNANVTIFYDGSIDLNGKRVTGTFFPGTDDDLVGFAFGYTASDDFNPDASFWYVDWKGSDQSFSFDDDPLFAGTFHDITPQTTVCASGMRLVHGHGTPTADELWSASDLPENDVDPLLFAPGGCEEVARANDLTRFAYDRVATTSYQFDMDLTPTNVKIWINGDLQFDVDAPGGQPFETLGFGLLEQYQHSTATPDQGLWTNFSIADSPGTPPVGPGLPPTQPPTTTFTAANVDAIAPTGTWDIAATTPDNPLAVVSPPNTGDVAFNASGNAIYHFDGVPQVTARQNGIGTTITVEAVPPGAFQTGAMGASIFESPASIEANANFAFAFFPFAEGWTGAIVSPNGAIIDNVIGATVVNQPTPDLNDQDGLYDVSVPGASPSDGILFTCGGSNEDNVTAAIPLGSGWRVSVRDNGHDSFGLAETFENDDFCFLYVPVTGGTPARIVAAATVLDFDAAGAITGLTTGAYTLTREGTGLYRLAVPGHLPLNSMLLLTANTSVTLTDPNDVLADDAAPINYYLTYQADGDDFLIQQVQTDNLTNPVVDGPFSFAVVSFAGAAPACPCELDGDDAQVDVFDLLAYLALWFPQDPAADIDGNPGVDVFDLLEFLSCWFPASAGNPCP